MFKNDFQGGLYFEVFNPAVKDPLANFKVVGPHGIQKIYDKDVKSSVYQLDGIPTTTKLTLPKNSREQLSLIQRCIVFQTYIKSNQDFSMELAITDLSQNRRNLLFSTSHKDLNIQPLSARIPIKYVNRNQWTNLVFDLAVLVTSLWKNQTLKSIDSLTVCANCKLRKIFTLKNCPNIEFNVLCLEDQLNSVDFPEETNAQIQMFELPDSRKETTNSTPLLNLNPIQQEQQPLTSSRSKSQNVFKIAFGSKIPPSAAHGGQPLKSAKAQQPAENTEHLAGASQARKSSETNVLTKSASSTSRDAPSSLSNEVKKTSWNQRASAKATSKTPAATNLEAMSAKPQQQSNNLIIQSNKIPHPPPQSTRPTSTSARKLRLSSAVKNNQQAKLASQQQADSSNEEDMQNSSKTLIEYSPFKNNPNKNATNVKTRDKNIESEFNIQQQQQSKASNHLGASLSLNEDIVDLIQALKSEQEKPKRPPLSQKSNNLKQVNSNCDLTSDNNNNNVNYSFSSRPKAAPFLNASSQLEKSPNSSKVYDYRRYTSPNGKHSSEIAAKSNALNENLKPSLEKKHESAEVIRVPWSNDTFVMDSLNVSRNPNVAYQQQQQQPVFEVMDSFEANMLLELKAEMEANTSNRTSKNSSKKGSGSHLRNQNDSGMGTDSNATAKDNNEDGQMLARDNSGIQSPLSDDYNQTTSEKYNFDAITSSIDETTASVSKKTPSRTAKYTDQDYQDEMNFTNSLQIHSSKSVNLKDLPAKYSPLLGPPNGVNSQLQNYPISEEPPDDSQADIDPDSEDEIDLLYDPALDCYYDPKTSTYYALNME